MLKIGETTWQTPKSCLVAKLGFEPRFWPIIQCLSLWVASSASRVEVVSEDLGE